MQPIPSFSSDLTNDPLQQYVDRLRLIPFLTTPPTDADIQAVESRFSLQLPTDYVRFLRMVNGGRSQSDIFAPIAEAVECVESGEFTAEEIETELYILHFFHLSPNRENYSVWDQTQSWPSVGPAALVIAADAGGNPIFLDFSEDPTSPSVGVYFHDEGETPFAHVSDSFMSFLASLQDSEAFEK